jgi:hypothetical protein
MSEQVINILSTHFNGVTNIISQIIFDYIGVKYFESHVIKFGEIVKSKQKITAIKELTNNRFIIGFNNSTICIYNSLTHAKLIYTFKNYKLKTGKNKNINVSAFCQFNENTIICGFYKKIMCILCLDGEQIIEHYVENVYACDKDSMILLNDHIIFYTSYQFYNCEYNCFVDISSILNHKNIMYCESGRAGAVIGNKFLYCRSVWTAMNKYDKTIKSLNIDKNYNLEKIHPITHPNLTLSKNEDVKEKDIIYYNVKEHVTSMKILNIENNNTNANIIIRYCNTQNSNCFDIINLNIETLCENTIIKGINKINNVISFKNYIIILHNHSVFIYEANTGLKLRKYNFVDEPILITRFRDGFIVVDYKSNVRIYS